MRFIKYLAGAGLAALLVACGGGGAVGGGSNPGAGPTLTAASITLTSSATSVSTSAGLPNSTVTITAEVRNASGTGVSNEPITFSADSGVLSDASTSTGTGTAIGGALGRATAVLSVGTNKTPRDITVTVTVGTVTSKIVVPVVSAVSSIELTSSNVSLPSSAGSSVTITAVVKNQANSGIAEEPITFSADSGVLQNALPVTSENGSATVLLSAGTNTASRNITVTAKAGAITKTIVIPVVPGSLVTGPSVVLNLVDAGGTTTSSVSAAGTVFAKATLKDATGNLVPNTKVVFAANSALINLKPAAEILTDAQGIATVQMSAASLSAAGAGTITASATVAQVVVNAAKDFQLTPANLTLTSFDVGSGALAAYGNRPISVVANINDVPAVNTPVQVNFTASCGTVNPASVTTDATGKAATTYSADVANCAGTNVTITASSVGVVSSLSKTITISAIKATNLQFINATPEIIYLLGSGASTQSQLVFKVVDSSGNPVQNQPIELSLQNPSVGTGLSFDNPGNTAPVTKTSDASGRVSVAVFSGDVPTSVRVTAKLPDSSPVVQTNSVVLTVASGKAVQKAASIAIEKWSIEGLNVDGAETSVSFSLADRQGNPVPDGTEVNFVAESGVMIPARCVVANGSSRCSSTFRSSGTRPPNGRVSILASVAGEEDFIDANSNNKYDSGEPFTDMGDAYRDDNESFDFTQGEFSIPRGKTSLCKDRSGLAYIDQTDYGKDGTCDGVWGSNEVRKQQVLVVASSKALIKLRPEFTNTSQITFTVSDNNANAVGLNSMPTGTKFSAEKISGADCTVKSVFPSELANIYGPTDVVIILDKCVSGDKVGFTVTSPLGIQTPLTVALP